MDIEVNDGNSFDLISVSAFQVCCSHSHIVDIAETISLFLVTFMVLKCLSEYAGMMAWRSYCAEGIPKLTFHNFEIGRAHV